VELAEQFADGCISEKELTKARRAAYAIPRDQDLTAEYLSIVDAWNATRPAIRQGARLLTNWGSAAARKTSSRLLREIIGNPFRSTAIVQPDILRWNDSTVLNIAQSIYTEKAFARLPVLADALEEAGCVDEEVLRHCRQPDHHVRGCWALDLLLGRT
jgi:hypothetical protein